MVIYFHFLIDSYSICFQRVIFDTLTLYCEEFQRQEIDAQSTARIA